MGEWFHRHYFIKEAKPRLILGLASMVTGLLVAGFFDVKRKHDEEFFLNRHSNFMGTLLGFAVGLLVTMVLFLAASGIYNMWKRRGR